MIIPAIDLMDGKVVRLYQGDYSKKKYYNDDIYTRLCNYNIHAVKMIHIVDLDGAKNPNNRQIQLFKEILSKVDIPLQIGGGIRKEKDIETLFQAGTKRVVISSSAIINQKEVKRWFNIYGGNAIVLALDVLINKKKEKEILINGWKDHSKFILEYIINEFSEVGLKHVLCTDISKDGTLLGPNFILYKEISKLFPHIKFQSSGGVGSLNDISRLKSCGIHDVIIGRSLLEKKFSILEAVQCWQNA
ncbi:1-(5-phosphoribosyl)-5-[(5-phosphoribosylamino)methylideneamino]imidazole-4-carboxamide isomerase [Buchnera aphidicola]|uniref:1-(5-phosphoribosyl)-5-[(5- phosphoribosylamino)methylideneamino]imidazole-4- carboxamide isomerase n=1 Tax=Buchnera aphidicola TaxID=9 RepID=UPI003463EC7E